MMYDDAHSSAGVGRRNVTTPTTTRVLGHVAQVREDRADALAAEEHAGAVVEAVEVRPEA